MNYLSMLVICLMVVRTVIREEGKLFLLSRVILKLHLLLVIHYGYVLLSRNQKLRLHLKRIVFAPLQGQLLCPFQRHVITMRICSQLLLRVTRLRFLLNQRRERNISQAKKLGTIHYLMNGFLLAFCWRTIAVAMTGFLVQGGKRMLLPKLLSRMTKT